MQKSSLQFHPVAVARNYPDVEGCHPYSSGEDRANAAVGSFAVIPQSYDIIRTLEQYIARWKFIWEKFYCCVYLF